MSAKRNPAKKEGKAITSESPAGAAGEDQAGPGEFERAGSATDLIFSRTRLRPQIALVLGSGLGGFADEFAEATKIPYSQIPNFPRSTAIGHTQASWLSEEWEPCRWRGCRAAFIFMKDIP